MTQKAIHQVQAQGKWFTLSLMEQLANIGSEVQRALRAKNDQERFRSAIIRCFDLFYLTLSDKRWKGSKLRELARLKEVLADAVLGGELYGSTLESLDKYFYYCTYAARNLKTRSVDFSEKSLLTP